MKRHGNLYEKIYDMDNLKLAHQNAKKGKGWYKEVKMVDNRLDYYLEKLQKSLIDKTYKTSEYETFIKTDSGKEREIFKLPYFPDRVCQWAMLQIIEPYLMRHLTNDTYSAIPGRGIHLCLERLNRAIHKDNAGAQFCLKMDARKYYPSIDHGILKGKYRKLFKDPDLLWLIDEIIDSTPGEAGIPIGNYLSQYSGNYYLSDFDHWVKEVKGIKNYYRYMDDLVFLGADKAALHQLRKEIDTYFKENLKLAVKGNWQVFPTFIRGIDFVGYRTFRNYKLLRKSTCTQFKRKMRAINKKQLAGLELAFSEWCSINSYKGWLMHCDSYRLEDKYIGPIREFTENFYLKNIKGKEKRYHERI
ncbi:MAG: RNA-directed DNA polymerase [Acetobacterium sp.]|uniref:RNA-directed DNA polymerase n=1 Tax=Acetobacterium sp. TaxID=1872094 RepID=UPI003242792E